MLLSRQAIKHSSTELPELAWAVIGLKQPRDQDNIISHYQQKPYSHNVD